MKFSFIMQNYCIMSGSANQLISFNVFYDVIRYFPGVKMPAMGCAMFVRGLRCRRFFVVVLFLVISRGGGLFHAEEEVVFLAFLDEDVFVVEEQVGGCGGVDVAHFLFVD